MTVTRLLALSFTVGLPLVAACGSPSTEPTERTGTSEEELCSVVGQDMVSHCTPPVVIPAKPAPTTSAAPVLPAPPQTVQQGPSPGCSSGACGDSHGKNDT